MGIYSINSALSFVGMTNWIFPILGETWQTFCGIHTGRVHLAEGRYVNLNLKTDHSVTKRGYDLYFIAVDPRKSE